jgi:hypothetical protein
MSLMKKMEFTKEVGVWTTKLDNIMKKLWMEYLEDPRDGKVKAISEEDQEKIKKYLWME